ncbi:MAG TPA: DUF192 domain-containing protein [Nitrospirae bacterium]|nr:hypothetical protein BMS3Abin08_02041 [bacterium BMS3Abin08]HDY70949.1 DUF192 domain-containing protein [Nitrospirota bacterium]
MKRMAIILTLVIFAVLIYSPAEAGKNLIPNPDFISPDGRTPFFWHHGVSGIERVSKSRFALDAAGNPPLPSISITGGTDREGYWFCVIDGIKPGKNYLLSFRAYRDSFVNGYYPSFEIFGIKTRLNSHIKYGAWQDFAFVFNSGAHSATMLSFYNDYPVMFSFSSPVLREIPEGEESESAMSKPGRRIDRKRLYKVFPLGIYGSDIEGFEDVRNMGFNTVVTGVKDESPDRLFSALSKDNLNAILIPPANRKLLASVLKKIGSSDPAGNRILGFYIADEPEIRSVPLGLIRKKIKEIEQYTPDLPYFMAIVRPRYVKAYSDAADIILMDQYPIPNQPLTWLSESIDIAGRDAYDRDIWAVIQAFGGKQWKSSGWGRLPQYREMKALSYLSIIHGARGLLYFTYKSMRDNKVHRDNVKRLVGELGAFGEVFLSGNSRRLKYRPSDLYKTGFDGEPPVHAGIFRADGRTSYLIAVNTIDKTVRGEITDIPEGIRYFDEFFSDGRYVVKNRSVRGIFAPYEVKIYVSGKEYKRVAILRSGREAAAFYLEKASNNTTGLMFKKTLSKNGGMIFEFSLPVKQSFWMLNMRFPIDLLFFDSHNKLIDFYQDIMPCKGDNSCVEYYPSSAVRYALELRSGTIEHYGIKRGDNLYIE